AQLLTAGHRGRGPGRRAAVRPQDQWHHAAVAGQRRGVRSRRRGGHRGFRAAAVGAGDDRAAEGPRDRGGEGAGTRGGAAGGRL
ncbi:MAG: hypothetical protein AVDCRST_MAG38-2861, partial [uncultured Solirubrobacteraceae bacterium]